MPSSTALTALTPDGRPWAGLFRDAHDATDFGLRCFPAGDVDLRPDDFHHLGRQGGAHFAASLERHAVGMGEEEAGRIGVACAGGVDRFTRPGIDEVELVAPLDHRTVLADLDDGGIHHFGHGLQGLPGRLMREGGRFRLVGENDVDVVLDDVLQEHIVRLDHVVGGHVERDDHIVLPAHLHGAAYQVLVLHQIALDVEIVVAFEILWLQVVRLQLERGAQIGGEGTVGVGGGDEDHRPARSDRADQQIGLDAVLQLRLAEERTEFVVAHLADVARRHAQDGRRRHGVGSGAAGNVLDSDLLEVGPDGVAGLGVHMLHAAQRQIVLLEERIVRKDGQDVCQGISNAQDRFHERSVLESQRPQRLRG